ncbi:MAG: LPS export ABC transporter ATP-binding protein [Elusimicrobia bacterium RIFCSPLOWO2_01_FULL_59_12]|nr:MAG: LPS export ABC transporter ATP-binding protein [Elusimicrobia bacterium RIFCSPLOWO2_01_FULL_59_12]
MSPPTDQAGLQAKALVKSYGRRNVVRGIEIEVRPGEIVGLLGPNGAGKTTSFHMIVGLIRPESGSVLLGGEDITRQPMYRRARLGIGYLAQEPSIFRRLTVEQNLLAILEMRMDSEQEQRRKMDVLLSELGLLPLRHQLAVTLSGGEKRRCEVARALVTDPKFLLLDEPFVGIDPLAVDDLQGVVRKLKGRGIGVLITDHNVRETLEIVDRAYIMYEGRVLTHGNAQELLADPEARRVYLGERFSL